MKVNSITPNYHYDCIKANHTPAFKGSFYGAVSDKEANSAITKFFEKYMSPGCNTNRYSKYEYNELSDRCYDHYYTYYTPFINRDYNATIQLENIPESCVGDLNFYITNSKAIEDEVLDMTFDYYKNFVDKYAFKKCDSPYYDHQDLIRLESASKYLKLQYEYLKKYPERLNSTYKAKLDLFKDFIEGGKFQKVCQSLKEFAR